MDLKPEARTTPVEGDVGEALRAADIIEKTNLKYPEEQTDDEAHMIVLAAKVRSLLAEVEALKDTLRRVRAREVESEECASGKNPHNPDGEGDAMCEDGICYETGWGENIKDIDAALSTPPAAKKDEEGK